MHRWRDSRAMNLNSCFFFFQNFILYKIIKLQICLIVIFIYDLFKVSKCFEHCNSIRLLCYRCEAAAELLNYRFWKDYGLVSTLFRFTFSVWILTLHFDCISSASNLLAHPHAMRVYLGEKFLLSPGNFYPLPYTPS